MTVELYKVFIRGIRYNKIGVHFASLCTISISRHTSPRYTAAVAVCCITSNTFTFDTARRFSLLLANSKLRSPCKTTDRSRGPKAKRMGVIPSEIRVEPHRGHFIGWTIELIRRSLRKNLFKKSLSCTIFRQL